jgi:hypothetical protein
LGEGLLPVLREIQNFTKRNLMRGTSLGLSATKAVGQKLPRAKSFPNR